VHRPTRRACGALVLLVLLAVLVGPVGAAAQPPSGADSIDRAREQADAAADAVEAAQRRANAAAEAWHTAFEELEGLGADIAVLETDIARVRADLAVLEDEVREFAISQYVSASTGPSYLADTDINRGARADALARMVVTGRADSRDQFRLVRSSLEDLEAELAERRADQVELTAAADAAQQAAFDELDRLAEVQATLDAELARLVEEERLRAEAEARRLAEEEAARRAAEEAARIAEEAQQQAQATPAPDADGGQPEPTAAPPDAPVDDVSPPDAPVDDVTPPDDVPPAAAPAPVDGSWVCPVAGPHSFIDSWGAPRQFGRWHKGTDMMAEEGTPVVATVDGFVEHRGNSVGGLSAHLTASDGRYFYYTHLSGYAEAGNVTAGTVIGYVGMTGNAPVPHLHIEYHPDGRGNPVNPYPTLIQVC